MSDERAILLSLIMNLDTRSTSRNVEEKQLAIDITDNEDINNIEIRLTPNNPERTNSKSQKEIENVESFFYLYAPYPVEVRFTKPNNTEFVLRCEDVTLLRDSFTRIVVVNPDQDRSTVVKLIYS